MRTSAFAVLLVSVTAGFVAAAEASRPRGVGPEFAKFYAAGETFNCISNPSIQIPASQINDEFCDCPDGSDEPGTSACAHLSLLSPQTPANVVGGSVNTTAALPGFFCRNKGHRPSYLPFTRVNDGICDYSVCCDGSDEWENAGGVKCEDRCKEIGKEWKKQDEIRQKSLGAAMKRRKELVTEAVKLKQEVQNQLSELVIAVQASEIKVKQLEKEKQDIEKRESTRVVKDAGKGGKLGVLAGLAKGKIEELQQALTDVRDRRDSFRGRLKQVEKILETFKAEYNPNFNDEGVKRAVHAWEDYLTQVDVESENEEGAEHDLANMTSGEDSIPWHEFEEDASESDTDVLYRLEEYLPATVRGWVDDKLRDLRTFLMDNGVIAKPAVPRSFSESKAVEAANTRLTAAQNDLTHQTSRKKDLEEEVARDFGPEDVWRPLKGKCASLDSGEYTYEVCWMDSVQQISKKGGQHGMGNFERFDTTMVDDEDRADGKSLGSGQRVTMMYENGEHCWNGPNRRTTVVLVCSENEEIWKVSEEEKCVYRIEAGNPAVCGNDSAGKSDQASAAGGQKDEL